VPASDGDGRHRVTNEGGGAGRISAKDHPAFGMWADRDDMADPAAYVRRLQGGRVQAG